MTRFLPAGVNGHDSFILFVCPAQRILSRSSIVNAEAHVSTQPSPSFQDARFSHENEDQERKGRSVAAPRPRTEARFREARFPGVVRSIHRACLRQAGNNTPMPSSGKFPKSSRLLRHADFQSVYEQGRKHFSGNLTAFYRERNDQAGPRVGFTVGKVLGGAVDRNRIRRRLRAAVQRRLARLDRPLDVVVHPRKSVLNLEFRKLEGEVEQLFAALQKGRAR